jgi:hypothetical protein
VDLTSDGLVPEFVLFGEDASRILISCDPENVARIKDIAVKYALSAEDVGQTAPNNVEIRVDGKPAVSASVSELNGIWSSALEQALHADTEERLVPGVLQRS